MSDAALEIARLRAALAASEGRVETAEARAETAESELAQVRAVVSTSEAMIKHLRLEIARLRREQCGHSSERRARLLDQMELRLEELEAAATEDEVAAEKATKTTPVAGFDRRRPARKPFPEHPPRERVVIEAPTACTCCGSDRIVKMGEDGSSFHATPRGWAGPNLLAMVLFESEPLSAIGPRTMASGQHRPLNRQAERYVREGVDLSPSTLADQVGARTAALEPLHLLIRDHALEAKRLHGDGEPSRRHAFETDGEHGPAPGEGRNEDGPALDLCPRRSPLLGRGAARRAVPLLPRPRDGPPNRHLAGWQGILQADAYGGYDDLYRGDRDPGPAISALCRSHARRKFFELADIKEKARKRKPAHDISPSTGFVARTRTGIHIGWSAG